jgi:hypothetical protein
VPELPERRVVNGRPAINRAEIMRRAGVSRDSAARWWRSRASNGHPEALDGGGRWFDEHAWTAWHAGYLAGKRATLTEPDLTGDRDELIDVAEFARVLGYSDPAVIRNYIAKNPGYLPEPDRTEERPTGLKRQWRREQAWQFARSRDRRGGGRPPGTGAERRPLYEADPRIPKIRSALRRAPAPTGSALARELRVSERTAQRLMRAAREAE